MYLIPRNSPRTLRNTFDLPQSPRNVKLPFLDSPRNKIFRGIAIPIQGQCRQNFCCARLFEITDSAELWFHKQREDKVVSCFWKKIVTCDFSLARLVTVCSEPIWIKVKTSWNIHTKGQIISKRFFLAEDSSKKRTKTSHIVVKMNSFVHFLEESSARKKRFEIIWPLGW